MTFAHDFRANVIPRMRTEAKVQGILVATDQIDFGDARHEVCMVAIRGGVGLFDVDRQEEILERVPDLIWNAYDDALVLVTADEKRRLKNQVLYYEELVAKCKDPKRMEWVFAAICPEYRAHLQEQRRRGR